MSEDAHEYEYREEEEEEEESASCEENSVIDDTTKNPFGFNFSESVTQCFARDPVEPSRIVFFSGNIYTGHTEEGIIHGDGTYTWTSDGTKYTGTFNWGSFTGTGRIEWKDGSWYEGEVRNGIREGHGIYTCVTDPRFVYEGEFHNGLFNGRGTCYYGEHGSNHRYIGEFVNNLRQGTGTMYYPGGNIYEGEWQEGLRHGHGRFTWANGSHYTGEFVNGQMSGRGEMVFAFGSGETPVQFVQANRYVGEFVDSQRCGQGTFYYANGSIYNGEWMNDAKSGEGVFTSRDGRVYNNDFMDGFIMEDGEKKVPSPAISLNFPLTDLLSPSESLDEVSEALCNVYIRFLPKLRILYQKYSKVQWTSDATVTALRIVGMWRLLQDNGTILTPEFRLCDVDDVIGWKLDKPSVAMCEDAEPVQTLPLYHPTSIYGFSAEELKYRPVPYENDALGKAPDPFATLFLYQLFEALVRLAHHIMKEMYPGSLVLQVTKFLENSVFADHVECQNEWARFRESISSEEFDGVVKTHSTELIKAYVEFAGYASGSSVRQARQLSDAVSIDTDVDVRARDYQGLMTVRDLIVLLGDKSLFGGFDKLTVMDLMKFIRYSSIAREIDADELEMFEKYPMSFTQSKITFLEFVQALIFVSDRMIDYDWTGEMKFEYILQQFKN